MNRSKFLKATLIAGLTLVVGGFAATPSKVNASMNPAQRVQATFDMLADAGHSPASVRVVAIGYQTDSTSDLLLRTPGA